jgi:hypothetical protein
MLQFRQRFSPRMNFEFLKLLVISPYLSSYLTSLSLNFIDSTWFLTMLCFRVICSWHAEQKRWLWEALLETVDLRETPFGSDTSVPLHFSFPWGGSLFLTFLNHAMSTRLLFSWSSLSDVTLRPLLKSDSSGSQLSPTLATATAPTNWTLCHFFWQHVGTYSECSQLCPVLYNPHYCAGIFAAALVNKYRLTPGSETVSDIPEAVYSTARGGAEGGRVIMSSIRPYQVSSSY